MKKFTVSGGMFPSYRYKTEKGEISRIDPSEFTMGAQEIYCIEGDLFDDIERYATLEEAETRIKELLDDYSQVQTGSKGHNPE